MKETNQGFSLIHLTIVIAIIAILMMVLIRSWPGNSPIVRGEAYQLAQHLQYARHYAVSHDTSVRVTFNTSAKTYQFADETGTTSINFPAQNASSIALDSGTTLALTNLPNNYVIFDNDGKAYTTSGTALSTDAAVSLSGAGLTGTVTIKAYSGAIVGPVVS